MIIWMDLSQIDKVLDIDLDDADSKVHKDYEFANTCIVYDNLVFYNPCGNSVEVIEETCNDKEDDLVNQLRRKYTGFVPLNLQTFRSFAKTNYNFSDYYKLIEYIPNVGLKVEKGKGKKKIGTGFSEPFYFCVFCATEKLSWNEAFDHYLTHFNKSRSSKICQKWVEKFLNFQMITGIESRFCGSKSSNFCPVCCLFNQDTLPKEDMFYEAIRGHINHHLCYQPYSCFYCARKAKKFVVSALDCTALWHLNRHHKKDLSMISFLESSSKHFHYLNRIDELENFIKEFIWQKRLALRCLTNTFDPTDRTISSILSKSSLPNCPKTKVNEPGKKSLFFPPRKKRYKVKDKKIHRIDNDYFEESLDELSEFLVDAQNGKLSVDLRNVERQNDIKPPDIVIEHCEASQDNDLSAIQKGPLLNSNITEPQMFEILNDLWNGDDSKDQFFHKAPLALKDSEPDDEQQSTSSGQDKLSIDSSQSFSLANYVLAGETEAQNSSEKKGGEANTDRSENKQNNKHTCKMCVECFRTLNQLKKHELQKHSEKRRSSRMRKKVVFDK